MLIFMDTNPLMLLSDILLQYRCQEIARLDQLMKNLALQLMSASRSAAEPDWRNTRDRVYRLT